MRTNEKLKFNDTSKSIIKQGNDIYIDYLIDGFSTKENRDFISIVSHNIRNPISAVSGYSELILDDLPELVKEELLTYLIEIKKNTDITYQYINKFFEWLNYKTGRIKLEPEFLNLRGIIEDTIKNISFNRKNKHPFKLNIDNSLEVLADESSIKKIFYYLIENAILFSKDSERIFVNAKKENSFVVVEIIDSGIGMSDDLLDVLFDKTKNLKLFQNNLHNGTGLSLILVDEFIKLNKGGLSIKSIENKGTTVSINLPSYNLFKQ